jgi:hypothetical protein
LFCHKFELSLLNFCSLPFSLAGIFKKWRPFTYIKQKHKKYTLVYKKEQQQVTGALKKIKMIFEEKFRHLLVWGLRFCKPNLPPLTKLEKATIKTLSPPPK